MISVLQNKIGDLRKLHLLFMLAAVILALAAVYIYLLSLNVNENYIRGELQRELAASRDYYQNIQADYIDKMAELNNGAPFARGFVAADNIQFVSSDELALTQANFYVR